MSKATPRPWKFLDRKDPMHALICSEDGFCGIARPIANIYSGQEIHKEEMRANANLIVRAVNNHDALLASCKEMREAAAAMMRVIDSLAAVEMLEAELRAAAVEPGFGVRVQAAIAAAEASE